MSFWESVAVFAAGIWAGTINTVVGSGTLVTFPTLLFVGIPPITANISNGIGLVFGGFTGTWGYRHELKGAGPTLRRYVPMTVIGATIGALLLLVLPADSFEAVVPVLIVLALVLVIAGGRIQTWASKHHVDGVPSSRQQRLLLAGLLFAGAYCGYFGAAQGVLIMGLFSALAQGTLQQFNAYKNVLGTVGNIVSSIVFLCVAREHVWWSIVGLVGAGAAIGGIIGARVGRRLPPNVLRAVIVIIGVIAIIKLIFFG